MTSAARKHIEELAARFLQEAVFASRGASHAFSPRSVDGASGCGLGLRPAIPDDFTEGQAALLEQMIAAAGVAPASLPFDAIRSRAADWIKIQDGIDRQRNHFLRDFRAAHGAVRSHYPPEVDAEFKRGLDAVNEDNRHMLRAHAVKMADALEVPPA